MLIKNRGNNMNKDIRYKVIFRIICEIIRAKDYRWNDARDILDNINEGNNISDDILYKIQDLSMDPLFFSDLCHYELYDREMMIHPVSKEDIRLVINQPLKYFMS